MGVLTREFIYSIEVPGANEGSMLGLLREAFSDLGWRDGEGNFGKIFLAGENAQTPPTVAIFLLCNEPPGSFKLTIRLQNAGLARAEELRDRVIKAISGSFHSQDRSGLPGGEDSVPWLDAPQLEPPVISDLPSVNSSGQDGSVELKIPVGRPFISIFKPGLEILISRALLEAMEARIDQIKTPAISASRDDRLEILRGARARNILEAAEPAELDGNYQVPMTAVKSDALFLVGHLLEHGLVEVVHFDRHGRALSAKRISVNHFGVRAGPTAGFGLITFRIGHLGPEILGLNAWVS